MKNKAFDGVEMKRRGAELVRQRLAGMTFEEVVEYWRQQSEPFQRKQGRPRPQAQSPPAASSPR